MADMSHPLDTFDGRDGKEDAERAADELRGFAQQQGYDLEVRTTQTQAHRVAGRMVTRATWGVFLAPLAEDQEGAQDVPRGRRQPHRTSS